MRYSGPDALRRKLKQTYSIGQMRQSNITVCDFGDQKYV